MNWSDVAARLERAQGIDAMSELQLYLILGLGVGLSVMPATWKVFRYAVTVVHEAGHALAALSVGRWVSGITVHGDMSGATMSRGKQYGFGRMWTTWWGYPAPAMVGAALVWAAVQGWTGYALLGMMALLAFVFLLSRSLLTVLIVASLAAGLLATWMFAGDFVSALVVYSSGTFLLVGAVRAWVAMVQSHIRGQGRGSDANALWRLTVFLPTPVWLGAFLAAILYCCYLAMTYVAPYM